MHQSRVRVKMLTKAITNEHLIVCKDDPVREHIPYRRRIEDGMEMYLLQDDETENVKSVICTALTHKIPVTEEDLLRAADTLEPTIAVFYTVWSYERGSGKQIIFAAVDYIKKHHPTVKRFVTMSPLTPMATNFHTRNGAQCILISKSTQTFEYII